MLQLYILKREATHVWALSRQSLFLLTIVLNPCSVYTAVCTVLHCMVCTQAHIEVSCQCKMGHWLTIRGPQQDFTVFWLQFSVQAGCSLSHNKISNVMATMCRLPVSSTLLWARSIFRRCKKWQICSGLVLLVLYNMCTFSTWYYIFSLTKSLQCISVLT